MTTEEVGAAAEARKLYSEIKGTKKQKPWKIVEEVVGKLTGRFFKCLYHDVGYGGQDYYDTHDESYPDHVKITHLGTVLATKFQFGNGPSVWHFGRW